MVRRRNRRQKPVSLASAALLWLSTSPSLRLAVAADGSPPVSDTKCDCFVTNGSDVDYYTHHKFFDFRSLAPYQNTPALLQSSADTSNALATSPYFTSDNWTTFWQTQTWNNSGAPGLPEDTLLRVNSRNNIYIAKNTDPNPSSATWLTLRTARQTSFQSSAEIVTNNDTFQFLSMRMLARTMGEPGGCTAMFTYRPPRDGASSTAGGSSSSSGGGGSGGSAGGGTGGGDGGSDADDSVLQEVDLEVLTKYPRTQVQCTNQPSIDSNGQLIPAATENVSLPNGLGWNDWAVYRLDWTPRQSTWYVAGEQIANISFQTPRNPSRIHINAWSDGGNWTGAMALETEAHLQIQWWELLYNSTAPQSGGSGGSDSSGGSGGSKASAPASRGCMTVCSIDTATGTIGQAVLVSSSQGSGRLLSANLGLVHWMPTICIAFILLVSLCV
ncbi:Concanavalin A-like lectin/glucanase, subgroup [Niveomyces insectorum RCEF 264]|uniref:Concanavalin A-like lectin/glucanase, subgroup n=1 Tax=Niveomyces insectorum RCEF 264 TaxID=1081102 RepID=A0A167RFX4_9HYPO|nr:Concanavalin A-like lectin/glucanase, subgroup [Niveomyces insectorum RCEF 264]